MGHSAKPTVAIDQTTAGTTNAVSLSQIGATTVDSNSGNKSGGTQRLVIATDQPALTTAGLMSVKFDQTTPGTTNLVAPISGQNGVAGNTGVVTATTQRVTLATDVALPSGNNVLGVVGGITATVTGSITRPNDTNTYASGDVITTSTSAPVIMTVTGFSRVSTGSGRIVSAQMVDSSNTAIKLDADLFLFDTTVTMDNDNAVFTPTDAELATCIGVIQFSGSNVKIGDATSGAGGNVIYPNAVNGTLPFNCVTTTTLYGILVARNAYIPVGQEVFTFRFVVFQD